MTNEYLIQEIHNEECAERKRDLIGRFYTDNIGLISVIAKAQTLSAADYYDYMQLGYAALLTALRSYTNESSYPFLSYFRRAFKHEIYKFNLEFHNPMRIKSPWYFKDCEISSISLEQGMTESQIVDFCVYDDAFKEAEDALLSSTMQSIMRASLNSTQYFVIVEIFWGGNSKKQVAKKIGCTENAVRYAYSTALKSLRQEKGMKCIARDLFGIYA